MASQGFSSAVSGVRDSHVKRLPAPDTITEHCPMCRGQGIVRLTATMLSRQCPTCRGSCVHARDLWRDMLDRRAYELGLAPIPAATSDRQDRTRDDQNPPLKDES